MKTILLFVGIVGCYLILSFAASPLDASLAPADFGPSREALAGAAASYEPPAPRVSADAFSREASSRLRAAATAAQGCRGRAAMNREVRQACTPSEIERGASPSSNPTGPDLETFAPYFRERGRPDASAVMRDYLRDPLRLENLVLL